jgi:hypothetical protein
MSSHPGTMLQDSNNGAATRVVGAPAEPDEVGLP